MKETNVQNGATTHPAIIPHPGSPGEDGPHPIETTSGWVDLTELGAAVGVPFRVLIGREGLLRSSLAGHSIG